MALIYASAINKRVNNMPVKSKRSSVEAATSSSSNSVIHQQLQKHSEHVLPASSAFHHIKQRSNEETHRVDNRRGHSSDNNYYDTPPPALPKRCISHCSCSVCGRDLAALSTTESTGIISISNLTGSMRCACSDAELHIVPTAKRTSSSKSHKNLHRSKTSCSDVKRKTTVSGVPLSSTMGGIGAHIGSSSTNISSSSHHKNIRKISTPVMMQSMYADTTTSSSSPSKHSSSHMRKNLAKKRLNQKYGMADGGDICTSVYSPDYGYHGADGEDEDGAEQGDKDQALSKCLRVHRSYYRRRSISLDAAVNGRSADGCWRSLESSPDSSMDSTHESKMSMSAFQRMRCRFNRWKLST